MNKIWKKLNKKNHFKNKNLYSISKIVNKMYYKFIFKNILNYMKIIKWKENKLKYNNLILLIA
jgi:hypothetical protein